MMDEAGRFESVAVDAQDVESALRDLHVAGATPIGAIRAIVSGREVTLRDAKAALCASPYWSAENKAAAALHDQILHALDAEPNDVGI